MRPTPRLLLRRVATASLALSLLVPLGTACGSGDAQGQPLDRDTSENPIGGGQPASTTTPGTAVNEYSPGANNDTGQSNSGQPQSGTDDSGGGNNSNTVNGN
jgi:hypothetical protein